MADINVVVLTGRIASDFELKYTQSGTAVAKIRIAVDKRPRQGEERSADFFNCTAWGKQAEFAGQYLEKGRRIGVEGRLTVNAWVGQDGTKHNDVEVTIESLTGLDAPRDNQQHGYPAQQPQTQAPAANPFSPPQGIAPMAPQGYAPPPGPYAPPQGYAPQAPQAQAAPQGYAPPQQGYAPPQAPQGYVPPQAAPQGYPQQAPPPQAPQGYAPQAAPVAPQGYAPQAPQDYAPPAGVPEVTDPFADQ